MSDPAAEKRHEDHEGIFDDHETRLGVAEATLAKAEEWRTGGDLAHRGAEARILTLEEHREKCDKVGVLDKFPEMRKTLYELKEGALTQEEVGGIIRQAVAETVQASATATEAGRSGIAKVLTAIGAIATPAGVILLGILTLLKR